MGKIPQLEDLTLAELQAEIERLYDLIEEIEFRDGLDNLDPAHQAVLNQLFRAVRARDRLHRAIRLSAGIGRQIEIIRDKNSCNKLTVTPNRVSIKLRRGIDAEEESIIQKFSEYVADQMKYITCSMRGTFEKLRLMPGVWRIKMQNESRKIKCRFYFDPSKKQKEI